MADACRYCDSVETVKTLCADSSPHYASLHCKKCHCWIKWLPKPKVRHGYAVIHIVKGIMETCEVFTAAEAARRRLEEILDEIWNDGAWEEWFEDNSAASREGFQEFYNDAGDRLLTIEDCKIILDEEV